MEFEEEDFEFERCDSEEEGEGEDGRAEGVEVPEVA